MIGLRQHAGLFPPSLLPHLLIIVIPLFLLNESIHGQPNYYFKASAPAVKSLPRIGRRSEDIISNTPSLSYSRSFDFPGAYGVEMWPNSGNSDGETLSAFGIGPSNRGVSSSHASSQIAPTLPALNQLSDKSYLWRRLLGDLNNYEEAFENMYRSKT